MSEYKLVPVVPTEAMVDRAMDAFKHTAGELMQPGDFSPDAEQWPRKLMRRAFTAALQENEND